MIYNIAVSEEGTSQIKNVMNNNTRAETTESATSGKTKICKKLKIINSNEKICIYIYIQHRQYKNNDKLLITCCKQCIILTGFNTYKTIIKSLASLEIDITEMIIHNLNLMYKYNNTVYHTSVL